MEQVTTQNKHQQAFSLIELLIGMALLAIITAIAMPSYHSSVQKTRRHRVQQQLLDIYLQQQHFFLQQQRYGLDEELVIADSDFYKVEVYTGNDSTFEISATANQRQLDDETCTVLVLNQDLVKQPKHCW